MKDKLEINITHWRTDVKLSLLSYQARGVLSVIMTYAVEDINHYGMLFYDNHFITRPELELLVNIDRPGVKEAMMELLTSNLIAQDIEKITIPFMIDQGIRRKKMIINGSKGGNPTITGYEGVGDERTYLTKKKIKIGGEQLKAFEEFWKSFNYKHGKAAAADTWLSLKITNLTLFKAIVIAARKEAKRRPDLINSGSSPKWAEGWLSARRWEDG